MGKRSNFDRIEKDFYRTFDPRAVTPLLPHLAPHTRYAEPCFGQGDLVRQLDRAGHTLYWGSDLEPNKEPTTISGHLVTTTCQSIDALSLTVPLQQADCVITNPPWSRPILHKLIEHFIANAKYTWLLLDADWAHTKQASQYMPYCSDIVAVGRVKWIPDSKQSGKDNCCWYRFCGQRAYTVFHPRDISLIRAKSP